MEKFDYQTIYTAADDRSVAGPWNWTPACRIDCQKSTKSESPEVIAKSYIADTTKNWAERCEKWCEPVTHVVVRWKPHNRANYRHQDRAVGEVK